MFKLKFFLLIIFLNFSVFSVTLENALDSAYVHNRQFKINQLEFLKAVESFPRALSEFIPRVKGVVDFQNRKDRKSGKDSKVTSQKLVLSQSVFNGGSSRARLAEANELFKVAKNNFYNLEQKLIMEGIKLYLGCYAAIESQKASNANLVSVKKNFEEVGEKMRLGEATRTEMAISKAKFAEAKYLYSSASSKLQDQKIKFKKFFNLSPDEKFILPKLPKNLPRTLEEFVGLALINNYSLLARKYLADARRYSSFAAMSVLFPSVNLNAALENSSVNGQRRHSSHTKSIGISLEVPILAQGGAEYTAIRAARNDARKTALEREFAIEDLQASLTIAWEYFNTAKVNLEYANDQLDAAFLALKNTEEEYRLGSKTIVEVLKADKESYEAKKKKTEAEVEYIINAYTLLDLTGQLTAQNLNLKVNYFDPNKEFNKVKFKVIGF